MGHWKRTKSLSKITRALMTQGESDAVDFKRTVDGVSVQLLVAFANMKEGGTILVGVDERAGKDGAQHGVVIGCDVDDAAILEILNKAVSCVPPVGLIVHIENLNTKPILRLVVPASESRPHCTSKGIYCCRDGSRNRPLHPGELLRIFLETEARVFAQRFETAAAKITGDLSKLEEALETSIEAISDNLGWAESKIEDTGDTLDTVLSEVSEIVDQSRDTVTRLRALFRQDNRDDPVRAAVRQNLHDHLVGQLEREPDSVRRIFEGAELSLTLRGKASLELTKHEIKEVLREAALIAEERIEAKKYEVEIQVPPEMGNEELDRFAGLVAEGGEVSGGLRGRLEGASTLGLLTYEGKLVGTAALKKPATRYRKRVFESASSECAASSYPYELGWVFLTKPHRGKKKIIPVIDGVLARAGEAGVYATTRASNQKMQSLLGSLGFRQDGKSYASKQHPDDKIFLFIRPPKVCEK